MNQSKITQDTRQRIRELTLFHFRLENTSMNFKTLENIFNGHMCYHETDSTSFLHDRKLLTKDNGITHLGVAFVLSNKLNITVLSVFVLSRLYYCQMTINEKMVIPRPTLMTFFDSFTNDETIRKLVRVMKHKKLLDSQLSRQLIRINTKSLVVLKKYNDYFFTINNYLVEINEKIDELLLNDKFLIKKRTDNAKLWGNMNTQDV